MWNIAYLGGFVGLQCGWTMQVWYYLVIMSFMCLINTPTGKKKKKIFFTLSIQQQTRTTPPSMFFVES